MAVPTNTYTRYTASNNVREDLADFIASKDPEKTPIISSAGRGKANQTLNEWSRDALRAPNADNAAIDGDDATASAKTYAPFLPVHPKTGCVMQVPIEERDAQPAGFGIEFLDIEGDGRDAVMAFLRSARLG